MYPHPCFEYFCLYCTTGQILLNAFLAQKTLCPKSALNSIIRIKIYHQFKKDEKKGKLKNLSIKQPKYQITKLQKYKSTKIHTDNTDMICIVQLWRKAVTGGSNRRTVPPPQREDTGEEKNGA